MSLPPRPYLAAIEQMRDLRAEYAALRERVIARAPWPLAADTGTGPEASWGPPEVLAHLGEMLPFWLGDYERIVEAGRGPGDGVPFGRNTGDLVRQAILDRDRTVPFRELFARIDAAIVRWEQRLAEAEPGEGSAVGLHPRLGEMTAEGVLARMILAHLEEHRAQLEDALAAP
jgi:hypothetical protein